MAKYVRRPFVVEGFQWRWDTPISAFPEWAQKSVAKGQIYFVDAGLPEALLKIKLLSGSVATAFDGDWVLRDPSYALYTTRAFVFDRDYKPYDA